MGKTVIDGGCSKKMPFSINLDVHPDGNAFIRLVVGELVQGMVTLPVVGVTGVSGLYCNTCTQVQVISTAVTEMFLLPVFPESSVATSLNLRNPQL